MKQKILRFISREITVTRILPARTILFKVTVKEIKEEELPDIDDELAKKLGNFKSLDELKEKILENVQQGYDKRIEQELNEQIFEL